MKDSMIEYLLDRHIATLDSLGQRFCLYEKDIHILQELEDFIISRDGTYSYKGHKVFVMQEK